MNHQKLFADILSIRQVLYNLISNALKFSKHKRSPKVKIGIKENEGEEVIYVKDNGIGLDPKKSHLIFDLFRSVHKPNSVYSGTGAGLAIVKKIILKHGGKVWVESKPKEGSTFYFSIPAKEHSDISFPCKSSIILIIFGREVPNRGMCIISESL